MALALFWLLRNRIFDLDPHVAAVAAAENTLRSLAVLRSSHAAHVTQVVIRRHDRHELGRNLRLLSAWLPHLTKCWIPSSLTRRLLQLSRLSRLTDSLFLHSSLFLRRLSPRCTRSTRRCQLCFLSHLDLNKVDLGLQKHILMCFIATFSVIRVRGTHFNVAVAIGRPARKCLKVSTHWNLVQECWVVNLHFFFLLFHQSELGGVEQAVLLVYFCFLRLWQS